MFDDASSELPPTTDHSLLLETSELASLLLSIMFLPELPMISNGVHQEHTQDAIT